MRTPGRCTNLEGCWIGATQRDVWLSVGEDFTCPNCGGVLAAPPRHSISVKRFKKVAVGAAVVTASVAAMALVGVRLSTVHWIPQPQVASHRHPAVQLAMASKGVMRPAHSPDTARALAAPPPASPPHAIPDPVPQASLSHPPDTEDHSAVSFAKPLAKSGGGMERQAGPSAPSSVLLFAGTANTSPPASGTSSAQLPNVPQNEPADEALPPPAAMVTMVSEAAFVLPLEEERPVVLPISFGRPQAPEDDAPPVSMHWRYHGFVNTRGSYFLPAPSNLDPLLQICRTPALLR